MPENLKFKQGSWWAYKTKNGIKKEKKLETKNKATARQRRDKWFNQLKEEKWGEQTIPTFREAAKLFVVNHLPRLKPRSAERYQTSIIQLMPYFSDIKIDEIKHVNLDLFERARKEDDEVTDSTIIKDFACLSSIYSMMEAFEYVDKTNPITTYKKRRRLQGGLKESQPRTRYLTLEEEQKILEHASDTVRPMIEFAIDTGLRRSEQFLLETCNVDLSEEYITVSAQTAKNSKSRQIPIKERTLEYLKRKANQQYVFMTKDGNHYSPIAPSNLDALKTAARKAGIEDVTWHDLRRTCGCRLLQEDGMKMEEVRDWLGHSSVVVTERVYAFLKIGQLKKALKRKVKYKYR